MPSARSRKALTYDVTYVSLEDCTLRFETGYTIECRGDGLAHMPMRTSVSEHEALQRLIESYIDDRYLQMPVCRSREWPAALS